MAKEIFKSPAGAFFVNVNTVTGPGEGGQVVISADQRTPELFDNLLMYGASLTLNFRRDKPMMDFPNDSKDSPHTVKDDPRRYTIVIIEE